MDIRLHHIWGPVCNHFLENGNGAALITVFLAQLVRTNLIVSLILAKVWPQGHLTSHAARAL